MLPAQKKKVDLASMTEEEKKLFRLYGKLPTHKNVLTKVQKDRKYFDSGDYALSKAGVAPQSNVGTAIPSPETIPHASPPSNLSTGSTPISTPGVAGLGTSPVRESSLASGSSTSPIESTHPHPLPHVETHGAHAHDVASTSPTSSYPIAGHEVASSPLNPAISGESASNNNEDAEMSTSETTAGNATSEAVNIPHATHPRTVDFTTMIPGLHKKDLPSSSTPASGALADTDQA